MSNRDDPEFDENCDPANPYKLRYDDVLAASKRIAGHVVYTPCNKAIALSEDLGMEIYLKNEGRQYTGSFKERGVRNTLMQLSEEQKKRGVVAASSGNHGQAMSHHATVMGILCVVVMPICAPVVKVTRCKKLGATTVLHGNNLAEAKLHAMSLARDKKMLYINGFDHPHVLGGQGTTGIEILEQVPAADAVVVPIGGGSLFAGVATAVKHLKPDTLCYGVNTEKTSGFAESLKRGERTWVPTERTVADGLAVNMCGVNPFHTVHTGKIMDKMLVVSEDWVGRAIMKLVERERIVAEGAGATGLAALMAGLLPNLKGKTVVVVLTGGNIDSSLLTRAMQRGQAAEGRLVKFRVTLTDQAGELSRAISLMTAAGVNLRDCQMTRDWVRGDLFGIDVKLLVETSGPEHARHVVELVKKNFKQYHIVQSMDEEGAGGAHPKPGPCLAPNPVCMMKK